MSWDDRRQRGNTMCLSLWDDVNRVAGPGFRLPECWDIVGPEGTEFLEALTAWELTGEPEILERVRVAYDKLVSAWKDAASLYEARAQESA